jgi:hypothetical protein
MNSHRDDGAFVGCVISVIYNGSRRCTARRKLSMDELRAGLSSRGHGLESEALQALLSALEVSRCGCLDVEVRRCADGVCLGSGEHERLPAAKALGSGAWVFRVLREFPGLCREPSLRPEQRQGFGCCMIWSHPGTLDKQAF